MRRFARRALLPLELAALASIFCARPGRRADRRGGHEVGDLRADATPWEIEKALRAEAQTQARSLHQCFDVLPISCQHSGYVGVGVSLSREGEIREHWIARSTYGADCPVEQCMSDVVSTWFFEPLPESMRVILPVQVLRTDKPLPYGTARAAADLRAQQRAPERVATQRQLSGGAPPDGSARGSEERRRTSSCSRRTTRSRATSRVGDRAQRRRGRGGRAGGSGHRGRRRR